MRELRIGNTLINDQTKPYLIAEVGHNHQGSLETCIQLIRAASYAGASAVKLQKRNNAELFTSAAYNAPYNSENAFGSTYGAHREALEFGESEYQACYNEAKKLGIDFFATAFDFSSADFLFNLGVPAIKIASGDLRTLPLLDYIAKRQIPMIISTGGGTIKEIESAVETISKHDCPVSILQCTAGYPPKYEELNLLVIETLRKKFPETVIGYSGHDSGIAMSLVAYVLGARVIEKHFTLNRAMKGTDHAFSLEPDGLRKLVRDLERAKIALGDGVKTKYSSEEQPLLKMGKSIVASSNLTKGEILNFKNLNFKSPGGGLSPAIVNELIGKKLSRDLLKDECIDWKDLE